MFFDRCANSLDTCADIHDRQHIMHDNYANTYDRLYIIYDNYAKTFDKMSKMFV